MAARTALRMAPGASVMTTIVAAAATLLRIRLTRTKIQLLPIPTADTVTAARRTTMPPTTPVTRTATLMASAIRPPITASAQLKATTTRKPSMVGPELATARPSRTRIARAILPATSAVITAGKQVPSAQYRAPSTEHRVEFNGG